MLKVIKDSIREYTEKFIGGMGIEKLDKVEEAAENLKELVNLSPEEEDEFKTSLEAFCRAISVLRHINGADESIFDGTVVGIDVINEDGTVEEKAVREVHNSIVKDVTDEIAARILIREQEIELEERDESGNKIKKVYPVKVTRGNYVLYEDEKVAPAIRKAIRSSIIYELDSTIDSFKKAMKDYYAKREVERIIRTQDLLSMIDPTVPNENYLTQEEERSTNPDFFNYMLENEIRT